MQALIRYPIIAFLCGVAGTIAANACADTLEVGPGKPLSRIEQANDLAQPGDVILVYPRENGRPYEQTAVYVRQPNLTFRAGGPNAERIGISGAGFDYSGSGSTPRAIFQFNAGADRCVLEGFELRDAHNSSHNGAGVRINQANHVTIRNCDIHDNDMGIMSNGDGTLATGIDQWIESCSVHHNGSLEEPGYNHNFYLGGTSVTIRFCDVHHSLTGHNVKSRAHYTRVEYSFIHDSANREFDLVDAADTERPASDALLMGCIIAKDPDCRGNRGVIHFGQDGGKSHDGTLHLVHNSIVTPFIAPVVDISSPSARVQLLGNIVCDGGVRQHGQVVVTARAGASTQNLTGRWNWFSGSFAGPQGTGLDPATNEFRRLERTFVNLAEQDFRLADEEGLRASGRYPVGDLKLPDEPPITRQADRPALAWQYRHPAGGLARRDGQALTLGAIETPR